MEGNLLFQKKNNKMDKSNFNPFKPLKTSITKGVKEVIVKLLTNNTVVTQDDKDSHASEHDQSAEELFSSFTANIIKEETLFTR
jgi:hypothetical protein